MTAETTKTAVVPVEPTDEMLRAAYATNEPFLPRAVYAAMLAAAPEANRDPQAGEWRDMKTAPKDGTVFLVGYDDSASKNGRLEANQRVYEARWNEEQGTWTARNGFLDHTHATHWMPLPASPQDDRMGAEPTVSVPRSTYDALVRAYPGDPTLIGLRDDRMGGAGGRSALFEIKPDWLKQQIRDAERLADTKEGEGT